MKLFTFWAGLLMVAFIAQPQQTETFQQKGKTLVFTNTDPHLDESVKDELVDTFFEVYPKMSRDFNPKAPDTIRVKVDTAYGGVAYANGGGIVISSQWLHRKPKDTDVVTHEAMHIVQSYPGHSGPGWLTEGIADYVRYKYGVHNDASGWSLTDYSSDQSYTDSYRITARFLAWLTQNYDQQIVQKLDEHMRNRTYSDDLWQELTGSSLDELWQEYGKNPKI